MKAYMYSMMAIAEISHLFFRSFVVVTSRILRNAEFADFLNTRYKRVDVKLMLVRKLHYSQSRVMAYRVI